MLRRTSAAAAFIAASLALLSGCAGSGSPLAAGAADAPYVVPPGVDMTRLLAPPPEGSALARDLQGVRAAQQARTPEQIAQAEAHTTVDVFLFAPVLGSGFTPERAPKTADFFARVYSSTLPYLQATKDCWNRERPFEADPTLMPLERSLASTRLRSAPAPVPAAPQSPADSPCTAPAADRSYAAAYPSGHAMVGAMQAILLAAMVPERRAALFERGWEYGDARLISGVHFPSDIEAGRILGTVLVGMMQQDERFRADLGAAREELRLVLGFP